MARSIRRAITAGTVITAAVTALWAWSTTLTSAGPPPVPHMTGSPIGDYLQMAGTVTGSAPELFAVTALIFTACFTIAGLAPRKEGRLMAGRFTAGGRTYPDTPAGRLLAAKDKASDALRLHGHQMMHWGKEAKANPPYFRATCGNCGAGVKIVTGRPPSNLPGYPSLLRFHQVRWCPGRRR